MLESSSRTCFLVTLVRSAVLSILLTSANISSLLGPWVLENSSIKRDWLLPSLWMDAGGGGMTYDEEDGMSDGRDDWRCWLRYASGPKDAMDERPAGGAFMCCCCDG